ncbi:uncharacterized protein LOC128648863 [Bombina bombina]|uniref:uncharacterized protein LOC128648863 n=1 Tax=Bombina bombina TaxID=8345 RepID=UPI00235A738A|nr:uncharacterized protein LOC128648863 [Bombina bombina]
MSFETATLQFSEWDTGRRKLRYLFLSPPSSFKLYSRHLDEENMIPLFLGADVVAQTRIRTENHPKLHAKFAKRGLATKLTFSPDFKFERLRLPNSVNSLWFYSIQGVFRVAFDMYNGEDQLAVIESLQDLWKIRLKDDPLNKDYNLKCLGCTDQMEETFRHNDTYVAKELCSPFPICKDEQQNIPAVTEHNYCMTDHQASLESHPKEAKSNDLFDKIKSLLDVSANIATELNDKLKTLVLMLVHVIELAMNGEQCLDKIIVSIIYLLDAASNLSATGSLSGGNSSVYENNLLLEVSSWLGNRFQRENEYISQQVEEFKRRHIDHISDLPPAEELVDALFPKAMKVLLVNWMGLSGEGSALKLKSEYPILLLILEFANHNLITGVAHVLYSTLISK